MGLGHQSMTVMIKPLIGDTINAWKMFYPFSNPTMVVVNVETLKWTRVIFVRIVYENKKRVRRKVSY